MVKEPEAASRILAVICYWIVPLVLLVAYISITFDWDRKQGHGFEIGITGFTYVLLGFLAVTACTSFGYFLALLVTPKIASVSQMRFSILSGIVGVATIACAWWSFPKLGDLLDRGPNWAMSVIQEHLLVSWVVLLVVTSWIVGFSALKIAARIRFILPVDK